MYILAIDPGIMNLALAVVEVKDTLPPLTATTPTLASLCAHTRLAHWQRVDLSAGRRNASHAFLCAQLLLHLDSMAYLYSKCSAVGIEHQMATNHDANAVQNYALMYFKCRYPNIHVQLIRPLWKTLHLGALSFEAGVSQFNLDKYEHRKRWSVATITRCRELWKEMPMDLYCPEKQWQFQPKTWIEWESAAPKQDDLADAALTVLGWIIHTKGQVVPTAPENIKAKVQRKLQTNFKPRAKPLAPAQQRRIDAAWEGGGLNGNGEGNEVAEKPERKNRFKRYRKFSRQ